MPHAALWVVQPRAHSHMSALLVVSMPHAALWVVQQRLLVRNLFKNFCFNAARGFVGGATG